MISFGEITKSQNQYVIIEVSNALALHLEIVISLQLCMAVKWDLWLYSFLIHSLGWIERYIMGLYSWSKIFVTLCAITKGKFEGEEIFLPRIWKSQRICFLGLLNLNSQSCLHSPWPLTNHKAKSWEFVIWIWKTNVFHLFNYIWHVHRSEYHLNCTCVCLMMKQTMSCLTKCSAGKFNILKNHWNNSWSKKLNY